MIADDSDRNPVEELAEEFLRRHRQGENPSISEYVSQYPQWEDDIRDVFSAVMLIEDANPAVDETGTNDLPTAGVLDGTKLEQLGDFRVLREIGRGGMGIVYEAEQVSLGRHVALKVLPAHAMLDQKYLQRFEREARAAGRLHHSNIVPVFGVGHQDGLHYYVMQFIRGMGLDEVLADIRKLRQPDRQIEPTTCVQPSGRKPNTVLAESLISGQFRAPNTFESSDSKDTSCEAPQVAVVPPSVEKLSSPELVNSESVVSSSGRTYWKSIARVAVQVADALDYAHDHGTLHRDIKPSNLLLDSSGTVWVTDFGLAKLEEEVDLTRTGDIVGTLRYLAPEMLKGKSDGRSDVYSLGLTLYEFATLQPAYADSSRHRLVEKVAKREMASPRKVNAQIPRDLETIVLKATALEPSRRYQTAGEMKRDLERFLEDKPIEARRASLLERWWRWTRRNPVVASLTSAVAILLVVVSAISYASRQRALTDLQEKTRESNRATANETRAIESLFEARVAQAQATLASRRVGQRVDTIEAVKDAARLIPRLQYGEKQRRDLRNLTIAALRLIDIQPRRSWPHDWSSGQFFSRNQTITLYAHSNRAQRDIHIHRMDDNHVIARLKVSQPWHTISAFEFSHDDKYAAAIIRSLSNRQLNHLVIWEVEDGALPLLSMRAHMLRERTNPFCFHPTENAIALSTIRGQIRLLRLPSQENTVIQQGQIFAPTLQFSPNGERIAAYRKGRIDVIDASSGDTLWTKQGVDHVFALNWSPDGIRLTAAGPQQIYIYDTSQDPSEAVDDMVTMRLIGDGGYAADFNDTGRLLLTNGSSMARLWDGMNGRELLQLNGVQEFSRRGDRVSSSVGYADVLQDSDEHFLLQLPPSESSPRAQQMDVHPNGRLLFSGRAIWDLAHRSVVWTDDTGVGGTRRFRGEQSLLEFGSRGLREFQLARKEQEDEILFECSPGRPFESSALGLNATSDTGLVVAAGYYRRPYRVTMIDLAANRTIAVRPHHAGAKFVDITRDGKFLATGTWHGSKVRVWDTATMSEVKMLNTASARPRFSPDGQLLAICEGRRYHVYRTDDWQLLYQTDDNPGAHPLDAAFSPDGSILAVNKPVNMVQLLRVDSFDELARIPVPDEESVDSMIFDRSGSQFLIGTESGTIHVWNLYALRTRLASMGLDWDTPPISKPAGTESKPIRFVFHRK